MCTVYAHTQGGMQPIHSAATNGQTDAINTLVQNYGIDPQEANVCIHATNVVHIKQLLTWGSYVL